MTASTRLLALIEAHRAAYNDYEHHADVDSNDPQIQANNTMALDVMDYLMDGICAFDCQGMADIVARATYLDGYLSGSVLTDEQLSAFVASMARIAA